MAGPWEDYAPQQAPAQPPGPWDEYAQPGVLEDVTKSTGTGLVQGAAGVAGFPADVDTGIDAAIGWAMRKLGASDEQIPKDTHAFTNALLPGMGLLRQFAPEQVRSQLSAPTTPQIVKGIEENVTGPLYQPQTTAGKYARTVAEFAPGVMIGPGGLARRGLQTTTSALGSEAAGQATEGTKYEPYARIAGAIAGGAAPGAAARVATPYPISPTRQALAQTLTRRGVEPTAGQITGNRSLRYRESEVGGPAVDARLEQQGEQFTRATLRDIGENADRATPDVINRAYQRIGGDIGNITSRYPIPPDTQMMRDITSTLDTYRRKVAPSQQVAEIGNVLGDISNRLAARGNLSGEWYQDLRSRMGKEAQSYKHSDPARAEAARNIQHTLDDAMDRAMTASGNMTDVAALREARRQYHNLIAVTDAMATGTEAAASGIITPQKLGQALRAQDKRGYVRGQGDMADLARAGEALLKPLPQSGTAPRLAARGLPYLFGALGAGTGHTLMGEPGALLAGAAGAAAPYAIGRATMSRPGQAYLANQRFAGPAANLGQDARRAALIQMLMGPRLLAPPPDQVR